jgi:hypothetical protein
MKKGGGKKIKNEKKSILNELDKSLEMTGIDNVSENHSMWIFIYIYIYIYIYVNTYLNIRKHTCIYVYI